MVWLKIEGEDDSIYLIEVRSIKAISVKELKNGLGIILLSDVAEIKQTLESDVDPEEFAKALIEAIESLKNFKDQSVIVDIEDIFEQAEVKAIRNEKSRAKR
ncbi:hypothetical protein [Archaeoglobus sp.]